MITAMFSAFLLASETVAAMPAQTPTTPTATESAKDEKKICKREAATESRLGAKRVCLTAAEWKERQQNSVRGLGDVAK